MTRRIARTVVVLLFALVIAAPAAVVGAETPAPPNAVVGTSAATTCPYAMGCGDWKLIEVNLILPEPPTQSYMEMVTPSFGQNR